MTRLARDERYSTVAITFHWVIAALVVVNLIIGLFHESYPPLRSFLPAHKSIGITVLVLTLARFAWRLAHRPPPLPAGMSRLERTTAHTVHWTLYALLLAMPLTGWAMVSAGPVHRPLDWFGTFAIPYLPVSPATGDVADTGHAVLGYLMTMLVPLHIVAALRHHLLLRDGVLGRMAPALAARR